jgi:integrase
MAVRKEVADSECPGVRAKRYASGKVSFLLRYRRPGSRRGAKIVLGWLDVHGGEETEAVMGGPLTLSQARWLCANARRDLAKGVDPGKVKLEKKDEERLKAADTFDRCARDFIERQRRAGLRRWKGTANTLGYVVAKDGIVGEKPKKGSPAESWKDDPVAAISKRDVQRLTDVKLDAGHNYGALALFKSLRRFFRHCVDRGTLERSPLEGVKPPHRGVSRERVLSLLELRCFWKASERCGVYGLLLRHLLLTLARRDEGRYMPHAEISADGTAWHLPGSRTKNKKPVDIPLSQLARDNIAAAPRVMLDAGKSSPWVFSIGGKKALAGLSKLKRALDKEMLAELRKETGDDKATLPNWRTHDLRRTATTLLAEAGHSRETLERLLNHVSSAFGGVHGIYNRAKYEKQMRAAVDDLADTVLAIAAGWHVIPMKQRSA